jgi:hypothetical protein
MKILHYQVLCSLLVGTLLPNDGQLLGSNSVSCARTALGCRSATLIPLWEVWASSRSRCFVWCLWCLFGAEIGAIYAEGLKQLKNAKS